MRYTVSVASTRARPKVLRVDTVLLQQHLKMRTIHVATLGQLDDDAPHFMQPPLQELASGRVAGGALGLAQGSAAQRRAFTIRGRIRWAFGQRRGTDVRGQMLDI